MTLGQATLGRMGLGATVPAPVTMTWSPDDKSASCALSNGNLTATGSADNQWARATVSRTGRRIFRVTMTNATGACVGIASDGTIGAYAGAEDTAMTLFANGFIGFDGGFAIDTGVTYGNGAVIDILMDDNADVILFRSDEGAWSDPVDMSGLAGTARFPIVGLGNGGVAVADFGFSYLDVPGWGVGWLGTLG